MAIEERDHAVVEQFGRDSFRYRQIWAKAPLRFLIIILDLTC